MLDFYLIFYTYLFLLHINSLDTSLKNLSAQRYIGIFEWNPK